MNPLHIERTIYIDYSVMIAFVTWLESLEDMTITIEENDEYIKRAMILKYGFPDSLLTGENGLYTLNLGYRRRE